MKGAAEALGVTVEAVRKRIARGTLRSEKGPDGTRYVWLDDGPDAAQTHNGGGPDSRADAILDAKEETIGELRERVDQLSRILETRDEELRRKDTIIMQMAQRIPELTSAPSKELRDAPQTVREDAEGVEEPDEPAEAQTGAQEHSTVVDRPTEETARRSLWRRWFGFE
ncbi:MAG: hypothetical protein M3P49_09010 [Actinomycetota bacterium]|nr:hypothetical protein [Actinomycetota bacterium]